MFYTHAMSVPMVTTRNIDLTKVDFDVPISCTIDEIISCKLRGHPLVCHMETGCSSSLRIVRAAATHYPVLRAFLGHLSSAVKAHFMIHNIDFALNSFDFKSLMTTCGIYNALLRSKDSFDENDKFDNCNTSNT